MIASKRIVLLYNARMNDRPFLVAAIACLTMGGCQTTTQKITPTPQPLIQTTVHTNSGLPSGNSATKPTDPSIAPDSCASRLQDIEGLMIQFWLLNKQMPPHLADLQSVADPGQTVELTCGQSRVPFVYVRSGLRSLGRKAAIFVYDPTPAADGTFWCILADDPRPGFNWSLDVQRVPPTLFRTYQTLNAGS